MRRLPSTAGRRRPARPPSAPRPRARPLAQAVRRAQLLACALAVSAERGLGNARHSDVARRAKVAVPTVFHYFETREALARAVITEVERFLFEDIVSPFRDSVTGAPEALAGMLLAFADAIDTHPEHVRVWLDWSTAVRAGYWPAYLAFHSRAMVEVGRMIDRGKRDGSLHDRLRTDDEARVVIGLAHLIAHMKFAGNDAATIARTVRSLVDGYLTRPARSR